MSQPTRAIVFADRLGYELAPLHQRNCIAMFPIATKPLLDYVLEKLLSAGIRQVLVVISSHAAGLRAYMNLGERWGVELRYVLSRGEENPCLVMQKLGKRLTEDNCLVLRGDVLCHFDLQSFLEQAQQQQQACTLATIDGQFTGVAYLRRQVAEHPHSFAAWQAAEVVTWNSQNWQQSPQHYPCIDVAGNFARLDSLRDYQQANFAVLRGEFYGLILPCRHVHQQLQVGYRSACSQHHHGVVGTDCSVAASAELHEAIVSNGVIVDHDAVLQNTIVLPNTYIGVGVSLEDAVVWGDLIVHPQKSTVKLSPQRLLVADLNRENLLKQLARLLHRGIGVLVLLLSLPLWLLAAIVAWREQGQILRSVKLLSNGWSATSQQRRTFRSWEFATKIKAFRYLPLLLGVISGNLRLVGVMPREHEVVGDKARPWLRVCQYAPMGVLGPRQLLHEKMPLQEQQLIEANFAVTRRFSQDLVWVAKGISWFFNKNTWNS